jgi:hypothetical protein
MNEGAFPQCWCFIYCELVLICVELLTHCDNFQQCAGPVFAQWLNHMGSIIFPEVAIKGCAFTRCTFNGYVSAVFFDYGFYDV